MTKYGENERIYKDELDMDWSNADGTLECNSKEVSSDYVALITTYIQQHIYPLLKRHQYTTTLRAYTIKIAIIIAKYAKTKSTRGWTHKTER